MDADAVIEDSTAVITYAVILMRGLCTSLGWRVKVAIDKGVDLDPCGI